MSGVSEVAQIVSGELWHIENDAALVAAMGKVSIRWAAVDRWMMDILTIALGDQAEAAKIMLDTKNAGRRRLMNFDAAIERSDLGAPYQRHLIELSRRFQDLLSARNEIVHTPLVTSLEMRDSAFAFVTEKLGRGGKREKLSIAAIEKHLTDVWDVLSELQDVRGGLSMHVLNSLSPPEDYRDPA